MKIKERDLLLGGIIFLSWLTLDIMSKNLALALNSYIINPEGVSIYMIILFPIVGITCIAIYALARTKILAIVGSALLLAGIAGNSLETIFRGEVTDFIPYVFGYCRNFTDIGLVVGITCLVISLRKVRMPKKTKDKT